MHASRLLRARGRLTYSPYNGAEYNPGNYPNGYSYPFSPYSTFVPYPVFGSPFILGRGQHGFGRTFPTHSVPINRGPVGHRR